MKTIPPNETYFILLANHNLIFCVLKRKFISHKKKVKYSNKISYVIMIYMVQIKSDKTVISSKGFSTSTRLYYWELRGENHEKRSQIECKSNSFCRSHNRNLFTYLNARITFPKTQVTRGLVARALDGQKTQVLRDLYT